MTTSLQERFAGHMGRLLGPDFPERIALAVSGGGDSMAMLALSHEWARVYGVGLHVVTVDHGLRQGSCEEATAVAEECAALGHPHETLRWHWDGQGNLQDAARRGRIELIDAWRGDIAHVLLAHTQDDQAETLVMRLARGSGVEGLSAMAETREMGGWQIIRPLLRETRADLRHHADVLKLPYVDDPSNDDDTYGRVRVRKAIAALGLDTTSLTATATRMARARAALQARAGDVAQTCVAQEASGDLIFDRDVFAAVELDTQLRLLAAALCWTSSTVYRPRTAALEGLLDRALAGGGGTLHGARVIVTPRHLRVCREYAAVRDMVTPFEGQATWDSRWQVAAPNAGLRLRALGSEGWKQLPGEVRDGAPHDAVVARPALFDGDALVAVAGAAGLGDNGAQFTLGATSFVASLLSR